MHYYRHHIGDYRRDTGHLTLVEHGAYRQMMDMYYIDENPLTLDEVQLMRSLCARSADEQQAVKNILHDFFVRTENGYEHKRCESEISALYKKSDSARNSAKARWEIERKNAKVMQDESERNANALEIDANASKSDANRMLPSNPVTQLPSNPNKSNPLLGKPNSVPQKSKVVDEVISYLNEKAGTNFTSVDANAKFILARIKEGATVDQMRGVVDAKVSEWSRDSALSKYLRPSTLFNAEKFNQYVGQLGALKPKPVRGLVL